MKKIPFYLRAIQVVAPLIIVSGVIGLLIGFSAMTGNMSDAETGEVVSASFGFNYINSGIEAILIGIVLGALSDIGRLLFNQTVSK